MYYIVSLLYVAYYVVLYLYYRVIFVLFYSCICDFLSVSRREILKKLGCE